MPHSPRSLGHLIYEERLRRGWTQGETGEHFGVKQPEISKWESGVKKPAGELLPAVAEWLHITVDDAVNAKHGLPPDTSVGKRVDALESAVSALGTDLGTTRTEISALRSEVRRLAGEIRRVASSGDDVAEALTQAKGALAETNRRLAKITGNDRAAGSADGGPVRAGRKPRGHR